MLMAELKRRIFMVSALFMVCTCNYICPEQSHLQPTYSSKGCIWLRIILLTTLQIFWGVCYWYLFILCFIYSKFKVAFLFCYYNREYVNGIPVVRRPPEICSGYLILVAGSPTCLPRNLKVFKMYVNIPMLATTAHTQGTWCLYHSSPTWLPNKNS